MGSNPTIGTNNTLYVMVVMSDVAKSVNSLKYNVKYIGVLLIWGISSDLARASDLHSEGQGFDSLMLHVSSKGRKQWLYAYCNCAVHLRGGLFCGTGDKG